jgi:hypothetical protein
MQLSQMALNMVSMLLLASQVDVRTDRHLQDLQVADEVGWWGHRRRQPCGELNLRVWNNLLQSWVLNSLTLHVPIKVVLLIHLLGEH